MISVTYIYSTSSFFVASCCFLSQFWLFLKNVSGLNGTIYYLKINLKKKTFLICSNAKIGFEWFLNHCIQFLFKFYTLSQLARTTLYPKQTKVMDHQQSTPTAATQPWKPTMRSSLHTVFVLMLTSVIESADPWWVLRIINTFFGCWRRLSTN